MEGTFTIFRLLGSSGKAGAVRDAQIHTPAHTIGAKRFYTRALYAHIRACI